MQVSIESKAHNGHSPGRIGIILAGGVATRLQWGRSKMLAPLGGQKMLDYALAAVAPWVQTVYLVASPDLAKDLPQDGPWRMVIQPNGGGTGLAVRLALEAAVADNPAVLDGDVLVMCGDLPLVECQHLAPLMALGFGQPESPVLALLAMRATKGHSYGRVQWRPWSDSISGASFASSRPPSLKTIPHNPNDRHVRDLDGVSPSVKGGSLVRALKIVEAKDAGPADLALSWCNTGVMRLCAGYAHKALANLAPSPTSGELYLTDLVTPDIPCAAIHVDGGEDEISGDNGVLDLGLKADSALKPLASESFWGVNTQDDLFAAEEALQHRFRQRVRAQGALVHPSARLAFDTKAAPGVVIDGPSVLGPGVVLERDCVIYPFCSLQGAHIQQGAKVGPFAHVRPGTVLGPGGHIGNFVETKNTVLGAGSKAKHLSYLGDATLGQDVNIGAGVVICNYDGHTKHVTTIGDGSFVGSQSCLIAPIAIGHAVTVGAGSVLTRDVPDATLAVARAAERTIPLRPESKHLRRKGVQTPPSSSPEGS
jgi:bifunctional UDP-N-acetylglucosamine pyrophosphorylase / glucosamine-1-phosphate N-acetyltransferase